MYACIRGTGRIFSRGCAVERIGYLLLKTRPSRFVNRLLEIRSSSTPPDSLYEREAPGPEDAPFEGSATIPRGYASE